MVSDSNVFNQNFLIEIQKLVKIGTWDADLLNKTIRWSDVMKEIHEVDSFYQPDFSALTDFYKIGKNRDAFLTIIEEVIWKGASFDVELKIITNKGNELWVRSTGKAEWTDTVCTRIYGAIQDISEKKIADTELLKSRNRFESLIQTVNGMVWEADAETLEVVFVSDQVQNILGYSPHEWLKKPYFWLKYIHPDDHEDIFNYDYKTWNSHSHTFEYRMIRADGKVIWVRDTVFVVLEKGQPKWLRGMMVDITEMKRFAQLESLEKMVLELNSKREISIQEVSTAYIHGIEALFPHMRCSILRIKNNHLQNWASPSLPKQYVDAVEGLLIGENIGSCGTAAFRKKKVIVSDIANDIIWADYKDMALSNNLRACWSHPIINSDDDVIATFAIYYDKIKTPDTEELKVIERSVALLKIILENRESSERIQEASLLMEQGEELAHFGNWQWDLQSNILSWSDSLYTIYGLSRHSSRSTAEAYQNLLHPADRKRVNQQIQFALQTHTDVEYEERIIRPSGEIRSLKSWCKVKTDTEGIPVKMIGACLDITESKRIQEDLRASESRLRSVVDAQTNYVIRTDLNGNYTYFNNIFKKDFGWFYDKKDFAGENYMVVVQSKDHQLVAKIVENCLKNPGKVYPVELDNVQTDKSIKSVLWHFICLTDSIGEPSEIQCIGIDVSERKQAECALRLSNERYEFVNKATNDAIYDWNILTNHIEWGDGFYRLFGYNTDNVKYPIEKWMSKIHPSDLEKAGHGLKNVIENGEQSNHSADYQFRKMDGKYAYVEENSYVLRNAEGKAFRMIGVLRDVTKQKQEEYRLKILESAITHTHDCVLIAESDSLDIVGLKIIYANDAFTKLTGYKLEDLIGKSILRFKDPYANRNSFNRIITAINKREPILRETIQYKKEGEIFWITISLNPVLNDKGLLTHWICTGHDITDRVNYTTAIEKQNQKLQEIAWTQSHVVRAPLARLMGLIDLIKNYQNSDIEKMELLDHVLSSAHEFDKIIRDISDNTRQM